MFGSGDVLVSRRFASRQLIVKTDVTFCEMARNNICKLPCYHTQKKANTVIPTAESRALILREAGSILSGFALSEDKSLFFMLRIRCCS